MKFSSLIIAALAVAKIYAGDCGAGIGSCGDGKCCSKYGWCGKSEKYCGKGCQEAFGVCNSTRDKGQQTTTTHPVSTNGRCGPKNGNTACPSNECCSKYGWCGTSTSYCGKGCQSAYGSCLESNDSKNTTKTTTTKKTTTTTTKNAENTQTNNPISTDGRCGAKNGNTVCPDDKCCSKYGWCGVQSLHCGKGCQVGFGRCDGSPSPVTAITTKSATTTTTTKNNSSKTPFAVSTNGRCGPENGNTVCPSGECCSKYGWCGNTDDYCASGCQAEFGYCPGNSKDNGSTSGGSTSGSSGKIAVYDKCKNSKHWALTFDDGPYSFDEALLDFLKGEGIKATFFVNGNNVMDITSEKGRRIIKRMHDEGHEIGSHTYRHADLSILSASGIREEINKLDEKLKEIAGIKPAFIRPPYGSGAHSSTVQNELQSLGYTAIILWNVDTMDWSNKGDVSYALNEFSEKLGSPIISLNHCFYQGITESKLINSAREEIKYMKSKGYTPVTMSECLGLEPYQK